jgi:hypothetical protein
MSHHGLLHPLKGARVVLDSLTGIHNDGEVPLHCQQELHTQGFLGGSQVKIQRIQI